MTSYLSHFKGTTVDKAISEILKGLHQSTLFRSDIAFISQDQSGTVTELNVVGLGIDLFHGDQLSVYSVENNVSYDAVVDLEGFTLPAGSTEIPVEEIEPIAELGVSIKEGDVVYLKGVSLIDRLTTINNQLSIHEGQINIHHAAILDGLTCGVFAELATDYGFETPASEISVTPVHLALEAGDIIFVRDSVSLDLILMEVTGTVELGGTIIGVKVPESVDDPIAFNGEEGNPVSISGISFLARINFFYSSIEDIQGDLLDHWLEIEANTTQININTQDIEDIYVILDQLDFIIEDISVIEGIVEKVDAIINQGLGNSRVSKTVGVADNTTQLNVEPTRFSLYQGDRITIINSETFEESYREITVTSSFGATILNLATPISLPEESIVLLDTAFVRMRLNQHSVTLASHTASISQLETDVTQLISDVDDINTDLQNTKSYFTTSVVNLNIGGSVAKIQYSINATVSSITVVNLTAVLLPLDELWLIDRKAQTIFKVTVNAKVEPAAEVTIPLQGSTALNLSDNSYVHLSINRISIRVAELLEQIQNISGEAGLNGWTPQLAVVSDGDRRVLQVTDWVGGEGTKPQTGVYLGASGFVINIIDAIDIRGPEGEQGPPGSGGDALVLWQQRTEAWTLETGDAYDADRYTGESNVNVTVPNHLSQSFATGYVRTIEQANTGQITVIGASGVTIRGDNKTGGQHKFIQLWKIASNEWVVIAGREE